MKKLFTFFVYYAKKNGGKGEFVASANSYKAALEIAECSGTDCILEYLDQLEYVHHKEIPEMLKNIE